MRLTPAPRFPSVLAVGVLSIWLINNPAQAAGPDPATNCEVSKLEAAGKQAACLATKETKALLGKHANPAKCDDAFTKAFTKAEELAAKAGGACTVTGDVDEIEELVDTCVEDIAAALAGSPPAPCAQFPATGQTTAYQADKNDGVIGPVAVPDDGTLQAGATLSYTDNGDGTITDHNTGLMWEKKDDSGGLHDKDNLYRWSGNGSQETMWDWLDNVNAEGRTGFAEHSDWRIANLKELQSIVNYENFSPAVSTEFHNNCTASCTVLTCSCTVAFLYWSSTAYANNPSIAWFVYFNDGYVNASGKSITYSVRAVRGGQ